MKKLFVLLLPFLLFASPQEDILRIFDIPPTATHSEIVAEAQKHWVQQGKERWEYESRYEYLKPQLWPIFQELGMLHEIKPTETHYETVVVLGALLSRVQERVDYLVQTGVTFDRLVFLVSERPLLTSEKEKLPTNVETEYQMAQWVYEQSPLPKNVPVVWIDAPMAGKHRPNTLDTVKMWLETNPGSDNCLAISNQPYIHYQSAVLNRFVPFPIEVVGPAIQTDPSVDLMLDTLGRELTYKYGELRWLQ